MDKQKPRTLTEESNSENNELCKAQGIEEIPWQQSKAKQVPLPLEVPETYKSATRMLGLFKPTALEEDKSVEQHKKGIKASSNGTNKALTQPKSRPKPLPGLEDLEDLENEDPTTEPESMIVENHGIERGQEAQNSTLRLNQSSNKPTQRGVKHDLSDPHARENEHLEQVEVQGLEHMVVEDHGPKKGMTPRLKHMTPRLKPQFNPLFFPFATCLPTVSILQNHDLKEECDVTLKAHSQSSPMGREPNGNQNKQELSHQESSTVNAITTSPWPDQWRLEGLSNNTPDLTDPWPDTEGIDAWNDDPDIEELDPTENALYATPWGLFGEPRWITEPNDAIEPEPEEDPCPLTLHDPDKDNKSTIEGELSPQKSKLEEEPTSHETSSMSDLKGTLPLQNDQCDQECLNEKNPERQITGSTSDDEEETTKVDQLPTHQKSTRPTSDNKEETTIEGPTSLDTRTPPRDEEVPATDNATKRGNPHHIHKSISHPGMTPRWMTRQQNTKVEQYNADKPERDKSMMPLLQTSAHYPKMSKQNDRSLSDRRVGTLSTSSIQEQADNAKRSLSAMTRDTDHDQPVTPLITDATATNEAETPPSNEQRTANPDSGTMTHDTDHDQSATSPMTDATGTDRLKTPPSSDQTRTALTTLGIIVTAILLRVPRNQGRHDITKQTPDKAKIVPIAKEQKRQTTQNVECPGKGHWTQEELQYKNPPSNAPSSPSKSSVPLTTPTTPNNTPTTSPCLLPSLTPPLQPRSEDSGSKEKLTTTPGKAMTSSIHGEAMTTAAIPGTAARQPEATKLTLPNQLTTATPGIPAQRWVAVKVKVTPTN